MKRKLTLCITTLFLINVLNAQSVLSIGSSTVIADTAITGLSYPWEVLYGPDNYLWITERKGLVSRVDLNTKTKTPILDLSASLFNQGEAGLLGLALHPDFATVKEVFLVYTFGTSSAPRERLVKYTYSGGMLINPQILLDSIIANTFHDGSRLLFMPDKTLLMTTGEAGNTSLAQNMNSLNGKILRLNPDGSVPSDNPFPGKYIYTLGHRNPQGLHLAPNGLVYISEHGPSNDDEFQILEKGRNYGWPDVEGFCNTAAEITYCANNNIKEPLINWTPTIAPNDLVYYTNNSLPEFNDCILMTTLKEERLVAIKLNAAGTAYVSQTNYLTHMFGRLRDICVGPNKEIYIATNGLDNGSSNPNSHSILVLRPASPTVGIAQLIHDPSITIYPGLVKDFFTIKKTGTLDQLTLRVSDLYGRVCKLENFSSGDYKCDVNGLENGMYLVSIYSSNKLLNQSKIIISK